MFGQKMRGSFMQGMQNRFGPKPAAGGQMFTGGTPGFYGPGGGGRVTTGLMPNPPGMTGANPRGPTYRGQGGSRLDSNYALRGYANGGKVIKRKPNGKAR